MAILARRRRETVRATAAELAAANHVFPVGWIIIESDTDVVKEGDGETEYNSLPVWGAGGSGEQESTVPFTIEDYENEASPDPYTITQYQNL